MTLNGDGIDRHGDQLVNEVLGLVVGGSLGQGLEVKLGGGNTWTTVEDVKVGSFVTIRGKRSRFFCVVTDVSLGGSDPRLKHAPAGIQNALIAEIISGTIAYGTISVLPTLTMPNVLGDDSQVPVTTKTIPAHFSAVYTATEEDVAMVFGEEDEKHFWIGNPLDMDTKVCLNLDELVKRSIGVFGRSGTGKTFLTRLLLVGILQGGQASSLIFDMHSEYGWSGRDADTNTMVKGLKQLFPSQVSTFTLDEEHSRRRGSSADEVVRIGYSDIEPEDVELLRETLDLSDVAASACYNLQREFGQQNWMKEFLNRQGPDIIELASRLNVQPQAMSALHNRLSTRLARFEFLGEKSNFDASAKVIEHLERGKHVVLEFGKYGNNLTAYILISNLLTRRIHNRYIEIKDAADGGQGRDPRPVVIVIEEAHKFLNPSVASQTIFGIIAREMRKYNVTLMVIDQRPSAIDSEVMSQIGTRLTCSLDNERDIDAVLSGVSGSRHLRGVISRLEAKQQSLIFGDALPMPVVVHTRSYDETFYSQLEYGPSSGRGIVSGETSSERLEREINELF